MKPFQRAHSGHRAQTNGDLLALWKMTGASGAAATDESGRYDLAAVSAPVAAPGLFEVNNTDGAKTFDGAADYYSDIPTTGDLTDALAALTASGFSFEAWIRPATVSSGTFVAWGGTAATSAHNRLFSLALSSGEIAWGWEHGAGVAVSGTTSGAGIVADKTYHIGASAYDAASGTPGLKDVLVDVWCLDDETHFSETFIDQAEADGGSSGGWYVGKNSKTASPDFFDGIIDDVRVSSCRLKSEAFRFSFLEGAASWDEEDLVALDEYQVIGRLLIEDADGVMQDLTDMLGSDFFAGASWKNDIDADKVTGTVDIARDVYDYSLSFLNEDSVLNLDGAGSYDPLLKPKRRVVIEVATIPSSRNVAPWQYIVDFDGVIVSTEFGSDIVRLNCEDRGQDIEQTFIKTEEEFGSDTGVLLVDVLSNMLTTHAPTGGFRNGPHEVFEPVDSAWNLWPFTQPRQSLLMAMTEKADQRGWSLRYKWDGDRVEHRLTLYEVERAASSTLFDFSPDIYKPNPNFSIDLVDVHTDITVEFDDKDAAENDGSWPLDSRSASNVTSRGEYGEIWGGVVNADNINTGTEAQTLADNLISDLGDPKISSQVETRFFRCVELGDYYGFEATGDTTTTKQDLGVVSWSKTLAPNGVAKTTISCRGQPASRNMRHRGRISRPGIAPDRPSRVPGAAENVAATVEVRRISVASDTPVNPGRRRWDRTELYSSATNGFAPGSSNYDGTSRSNVIVSRALTPGVARYFKTRLIDSNGRYSDYSAQVSAVPRWMNNDPGFRAYRSTGLLMTSSPGQISFNVEDYDNGAAFSSNTYTAPFASRVRFQCRVSGAFVSRSVTTPVTIEVRVNGTPRLVSLPKYLNDAHDAGSTAKIATLEVSGEVLLAASDAVTFFLVWDHSKLGNCTVAAGTSVSWVTGTMTAQI